jgi:putative flippase GtrA
MPAHNLKRVGKFGIVGVLATIVHTLIFAVVMQTGEPSALLANTVAFFIALIVSFLGNAWWTFRREGFSSSLTGAI